MDDAASSTRQKALALNLDATRYGTFAEIGGGLEIGRIEPIRGYDESYLSIRTPEVLARIQRGDPSWEQMVPAAVAEIIKAKNLFGWQLAQAMSTA